MGLGGVFIKNSLPDTSLEIMQEKLSILKEPFLKSFNPSVKSRKDRIERVIKLIEENSDQIHAVISKDFGSRHEQLSQLTDTLATISHAKHVLKKVSSWVKPDRRKARFPLNLLGSSAYVHNQPLGVIGIIAPWNFPISLSLGPLIEVFAAGNNAMMKLSEFVPETSKLIDELIKKYFSEEEVVVINGGVQTSTDFTKLKFDHLVYTGSTAVAKKVSASVAENLVPLTLELGGKSPVIVSSDADMKKSVGQIMTGKTVNAGQICVAPDYTFVPDSKQDEFVSLAREFVQNSFPTIKNNPDYTSIIHLNHYERLNSLISDAKEKGATVVELNPANEDFSQQEYHKIPPTLILNPSDDMEIMQEEIFGPIMPIKTYSKFEEVIQYINHQPKALALYYFGNNKNEIDTVINDTSSGQAVMNEWGFQYAYEDLPFGGVGPSGSGAYHGKEGFLSFSHNKAVLKGQKLINLWSLVGAPFTEKTDKMAKRF
jgi:coniferyl-aldehyde dehydrogenase